MRLEQQVERGAQLGRSSPRSGTATPSSAPSTSRVAAKPTTVSISVMSRSNPTTSCPVTAPDYGRRPAHPLASQRADHQPRRWRAPSSGAVAPGPVSAFIVRRRLALRHGRGAALGRRRADDEFLEVAVPDGLVGLATLAWLARTTPAARRATVVAGMLGACVLDADKPGELFLGRSPFPEAVDRWHSAIQREEPHRMPQEVVTAVLGLLVAGGLLRGRCAASRPPVDLLGGERPGDVLQRLTLGLDAEERPRRCHRRSSGRHR